MATEPTESDVYHKIIFWQETEDVDFPYQATVDGTSWRLRINDFPDEPLFTLFIDEKEWGNFDDLPPTWDVPDDDEEGS